LTEEDLTARLPSSPSTFRWHNLVQWSRQKLVEKGEIDGSARGVWKLTPRGRARAIGGKANSAEELLLAHQATLKDLVYENESEVKRRIISELQNLGATDFEQFCAYRSWVLWVTSNSKLRIEVQTAASTASAYSDKVSSRFALLFRRSAGGKIRSAVQRSTSFVERSKAITTTESSLPPDDSLLMPKLPPSRRARSHCYCLTCDAIAESMIRNGIGVVRRPVQLFDLDPEFFRFPAVDRFI
jgi:restriction system protein